MHYQPTHKWWGLVKNNQGCLLIIRALKSGSSLLKHWDRNETHRFNEKVIGICWVQRIQRVNNEFQRKQWVQVLNGIFRGSPFLILSPFNLRPLQSHKFKGAEAPTCRAWAKSKSMSFRNRKARECYSIDMKKVKNLLRSLKPGIIIYINLYKE